VARLATCVIKKRLGAVCQNLKVENILSKIQKLSCKNSSICKKITWKNTSA
jgi:hypothetical protein